MAARLQTSLADGESAFAQWFSDPATASAWYSGLHDAHTGFSGDQELTVHTSYPGDRRPATERLELTLSEDGRIEGIGGRQQRPLWTLGPVTRTVATHGTVLSTGLTAAQRQVWATRLDRAAATVAASGVLAANADWDGGLVVLIPANRTEFTAMTGGDSSDTAAITTCESGTPRIVINPASFAQNSRWLQATLTHEAVHVATDSACTRGAAWVVEGMAESVAAASDASTAQTNDELVRHYLSRQGVPTGLPDQLLSPTDYALAQLAADQVRAKLGVHSAAAFFARGVAGQLSDTDVADATGWYLAELTRRAG